MAKALRKRIRTIVSRVEPAERADVEADVASLLRCGIRDLADLVRVAGDAAQPEDTRETAVWLAGRLGDHEVVGGLLTILDNPQEEEELRAVAAVALGETGANEAATSLLRVTVEPGGALPLRQAAAHGLRGCLGEPSPQLVALMKNARVPAPLRGSVIEVLSSFGAEELEMDFRGLLVDSAPEVRLWAAYALGESGVPESIPALRDLATRDSTVVEPWGSVREEAEQAIERIVSRSRTLD